MQNDLTTGSVFRNVVSFSLPYLLSYFLQTLYGMADLFIIGQFEGVASTTAVSIGSQVMHMLTVMLVGLAMGATVSIAQATGGGDKKRTASAIGNTVTLFMLLSLALTALLLALRGGIVSIMSTPEEAVQGTLAYLTVCFIGIPFITAYNIIASIFRGLGDSKSPMYFIAVACVVNIALDYYFMGTLHLGPAGAALGTTLSQAVSVLVSLAVILKRRLISVRRADFRPQRAVMGKLLQIGVPVALQDGFIQVSFVIITIIANRRGLTDAAAVGIVEKIIGFLFLIPSSMLSTVSALGAQNIGAGKPERARLTLRYAAMIACSFGIAVVILTRRRGRAISARLHLGQLLCRRAVQLQRLFLRLRQVGHLVSAQFALDPARARAGGVPCVQILPADAAAHGPCQRRGVAFLHPRLRDRLRHPHAAGKTCAGGIINGSSPAFLHRRNGKNFPSQREQPAPLRGARPCHAGIRRPVDELPLLQRPPVRAAQHHPVSARDGHAAHRDR